MISRLLAKPATTVQDAVEKQVFADCPDRGTTAAVGGFLPVRFRGAEVDRTFAIGHKDRHFLDPQQQAMAADIRAWLNRMLAAGDITARQLAKRAAGNPLDS
jgi:hypothetical protein